MKPQAVGRHPLDYAANAEAYAQKLSRIADSREDQAVRLGARLCRERQLTPMQIVDALLPSVARVNRLRRAAANATRAAKELRV